jgi:hypothetical protein
VPATIASAAEAINNFFIRKSPNATNETLFLS